MAQATQNQPRSQSVSKKSPPQDFIRRTFTLDYSHRITKQRCCWVKQKQCHIEMRREIIIDILFLIFWLILCEGKLVVPPQQTTVMVSIINVSLKMLIDTLGFFKLSDNYSKLRDLHLPCLPTKTKCLNSPIFDNT